MMRVLRRFPSDLLKSRSCCISKNLTKNTLLQGIKASSEVTWYNAYLERGSRHHHPQPFAVSTSAWFRNNIEGCVLVIESVRSESSDCWAQVLQGRSTWRAMCGSIGRSRSSC